MKKALLELFLLLLCIVLVCSCKESTYSTILYYDNTTNHSVLLESYLMTSPTALEWRLEIDPQEGKSIEVIRYERESTFAITEYIILTFNDGKKVIYDRSSMDSPTSPMNSLLYEDTDFGWTFKITDQNYNEAE